MQPRYSETFFLSAGEVNAEQELALTVLTAKIIDVATAHANSLHIGNPDMTGINGGWVLSRLTIEMERYPKVNETYTLETWIVSYNRHFSERAFRVLDAGGNTLGHAISVWMILDTVTHAGLSLDHFSLSPELIDGTVPPIERQARHRTFAPEEASAPDGKYTFRYCDLDCYRHVNTVRYVSVLLNSFTLEDFDTTRVDRFELAFLREAVYGMKVAVRRRDDDGNPLASSFSLTDSADGRPVLFARLRRSRR